MSDLTSLEQFDCTFVVFVIFCSRGLGLGSCMECFSYSTISMCSYNNFTNIADETYEKTDADFLNSEKDTFRDDGSTASTAVLVDNHLYVANVGDSRTVISKSGKGNI